MSNEENQAAVVNQLKRVRQLASEATLPRPALGEVNFEGHAALFNNIRDLSDDLLDLDLHVLPVSQSQKLLSPATDAVAALEAVQAFTIDPPPEAPQGRNPPPQESPTQRRDKAAEGIERAYEALFAAANARIAILVLRSTPQIKDSLKGASARLKEVSNEIAEVQRLRETASAELGVSVFAADFKDSAEAHDKSARYWLIAAGGFGVIAVIVAAFIKPEGDWSVAAEAASNIQSIAVKLVLLSLASFGIAVSSRYYRAHRHLSVLDKYRQNALSTFDRFVDAAGTEDEVRHAILFMTAQSIFTAGASGYLSSKDQAPGPTPMASLKSVIQSTEHAAS